MTVPIDIVGLGLASPLGLSSRATIAAIRAGFVAHEEVEQIEDLAGDPVTACRFVNLDDSASRIERSCFFARHALEELLGQQRWTTPPAVFLAGPEPAQAEHFDGSAFWSMLRPEFDSVPLPPTVSFHHHGRAGLFTAIAAARQRLAAGEIDSALVGGADSLVTDDRLRRLSETNALLGARNRDGLIPGEGAAFFLLRRHASPGAFATIDALALGREPEPRAGADPPRATGLSLALAELRQRSPARAQLVVCAQPSQRWWAREFAYAYLRNGPLMPEPMLTELASVSLGDLGAAAGPFALAIALWSFHPLILRRGVQMLDRALVYGCADEGTLGACLLRSARTSS